MGCSFFFQTANQIESFKYDGFFSKDDGEKWLQLSLIEIASVNISKL